MNETLDDQVAELAGALEKLARRFKLADAAQGGRPLAEIDKHILLHVEAHPGCGPSDVARSFGVPLTTVSSATDRLSKRGLLERQRPSQDRRAVALVLTTPGSAQAAALRQSHHAMFRAMLEQLSPAERSSFIAMSRKISSYED